MNIALWMAGHVPYPVIFLSGINVSHIAATLTAQFILWASIFCEIGFRFYLYLTIDLPFQSNEIISIKTVFLLALIYFVTVIAKLLSQYSISRPENLKKSRQKTREIKLGNKIHEFFCFIFFMKIK